MPCNVKSAFTFDRRSARMMQGCACSVVSRCGPFGRVVWAEHPLHRKGVAFLGIGIFGPSLALSKLELSFMEDTDVGTVASKTMSHPSNGEIF